MEESKISPEVQTFLDYIKSREDLQEVLVKAGNGKAMADEELQGVAGIFGRFVGTTVQLERQLLQLLIGDLKQLGKLESLSVERQITNFEEQYKGFVGTLLDSPHQRLAVDSAHLWAMHQLWWIWEASNGAHARMVSAIRREEGVESIPPSGTKNAEPDDLLSEVP